MGGAEGTGAEHRRKGGGGRAWRELVATNLVFENRKKFLFLCTHMGMGIWYPIEPQKFFLGNFFQNFYTRLVVTNSRHPSPGAG